MLDMVECYGLTDCNKSICVTPFKTGLPVDVIPPSTLPEDSQKQITKTYQQVMGDLNWLRISTRLDITTIHSILSAYSHKPSDQHLSSAMHVIKYRVSNPSHGLYFSHKHPSRLQAFFPTPPSLTGYTNANWGPMDALVPKPNTQGPEQSLLSLRLISGWIILHHRTPVAWGCL